ncbi:MAG: WbqC family protein, partial [Polaribacter sp.]
KDTLIENDFSWQDQHFKSLQSAYNTSPYFEFFKDDITPIFEKKYKFLHDVTLDSFLFIADALQLNSTFNKTLKYEPRQSETDFRYLADVKKQPKNDVNSYMQLFNNRHGFIPNLSVLDLLFMEGPNSVNLL